MFRKAFMMNPIATMTILNTQSMSLVLFGCLSYSRTRAGPRCPTTRSKTLHLGHTHFSIPSSPIGSRFIHGYPFLQSNSWQKFNKPSWSQLITLDFGCTVGLHGPVISDSSSQDHQKNELSQRKAA